MKKTLQKKSFYRIGISLLIASSIVGCIRYSTNHYTKYYPIQKVIGNLYDKATISIQDSLFDDTPLIEELCNCSWQDIIYLRYTRTTDTYYTVHLRTGKTVIIPTREIKNRLGKNNNLNKHDIRKLFGENYKYCIQEVRRNRKSTYYINVIYVRNIFEPLWDQGNGTRKIHIETTTPNGSVKLETLKFGLSDSLRKLCEKFAHSDEARSYMFDRLPVVENGLPLLQLLLPEQNETLKLPEKTEIKLQ